MASRKHSVRTCVDGFREVVNRGFSGDPDRQVERALDSMGGFSLVLAGVKIWLEHGIEPRFVQDRHPDALVEGWEDR